MDSMSIKLPLALRVARLAKRRNVDVPALHETQGLVTVTKNADGSRFDWHGVLDDLFRVHTGATEPAEGHPSRSLVLSRRF
jgi:hypothetical protein